MLKIEKRIQTELARLEGRLYAQKKPVTGWQMKTGYYQGPGSYQMEISQWEELPEGRHVGKRDLTVFLKNQITLDSDYQGKKTVLLLKAGGEGCVSINGQHYNGLDFNRNMILLSPCAQGDEQYSIEAEIYCKDLIMDSDNAFKTDVVITQSETAAVCQDVWDYYFAVSTAFVFIDGCPEEYTRQRVLQVIYDSLLLLDYREEETLHESLKAASRAFEEGMEEYAHLKMPVKMYFAGHSHIDVAWHWPLKETVRKVTRTFSSMLRLMEQYPDFKFCQSMPVLYEMAKEYAPELFQQIKERVKEGRWETLGSMYLEPDCNLISGESFVRQILYGKKFYQQELDSDSHICFLPDVFGYSSAMPQILKKAGTDYFFTTKLTWNDTNEFPYSVFRWRGIDGTEILSGMMSMCTERGIGLYNGDLSAKGVRMSLDHFKNKGNDDPLLYLYGHGDGGGGVTKEMLETVTHLGPVPMVPETVIGTVEQYFRELDQEKDYPVWAGELYFEKHRGTYTTAAKNKKNNRKSEFLYRNAEMLSVFRQLETGVFPEGSLEKGWKLILLNQFHDILPGTCISEVYETCDRQYEQIRQIGEESICRDMDAILSDSEKGITIWNTLSWERSQLTVLDGEGYRAVKDRDGNYPPQICREDGRILFLAEQVPALGYKQYYLTDEPAPAGEEVRYANEQEGMIRISDANLEILVGQQGEICSLYDKKAERQILKEGRNGNRIKLLEDIPVEWGSAWETTVKRDDKAPIPCSGCTCRVKEDNFLRTVLEISMELHHSQLVQEMIIDHTQPLVEFRTKVDWDERQKILRVEFPVEVSTLTARYDIAFGNVEHPNHATTSYDEAKFEVCGHKWGDVSDSAYGVALLNDCKYGYTIRNSNMELSLLRSADFPGDNCDRGEHTFSYWIYPHQGMIREGGVAQKGYEVNVPFLIRKGEMPLAERSYIYTDSPNLIIDTVKPSEDGKDVIVRLFETYNTQGTASLMFDFPVESAEETDLLEQKVKDVATEGNRIVFTLHPYEIKTFRIRCGK